MKTVEDIFSDAGVTLDQSPDAVDEVLEHHGIRGMKWGVRRSGKSSVTSRDAQRANTIRNKAKKNKTGVRSLSNNEINQFSKRIELEKKFHQLNQKPSKLDKGQKHVKKALEVAGTAAAVYKFSKSPSGQMVKEKLFGAGKHFAK